MSLRWLSGALQRAVGLCRMHVFAIVLALLVGAIYAGPDIYHAATPGYRGIIMADATDADFYLSAINKSYETPGLLGDPFQYEYRDSKNPFQYFLIEFILGKTGAFLHLPIDVLVILSAFLFPALLTLLLYAFAYRLSGSRLTGFFTGAAMLLGNEIVHPNGIVNALNTFAFNGSFHEFLTYSRPVNPQVSALFFFAILFFLSSLVHAPSSRRLAVLGGAGTGLLLYIYPYFWAFAAALIGVTFLYALVTRNQELVWAAGSAGVLSVIVIVPFLVGNLSIFMHGGGGGLAQAVPTHRIIIEKMILLPLTLYAGIYLWAWWSRGVGKTGEWAVAFSRKYIFVLLLLLTGVVVSNQQVLTGKMVFQQHFHFYTNIPVLLLAMSLLFMELVITFPRSRRAMSVGAVVVILAWFTIGVQVSSYKSNSVKSAREQALAPLFDYLRERAPAQSVIYTDPYLSTRLTIYTQHFSYSAGGYDVTFTGVPRERIVHDYFVLLQMRGVTASKVRSYLYQKDNRNEVGGAIYVGTYWRDLCGSYGCFPDSVLEDLIRQYQDFVSRPLLQNLKKYKIDYLLLDTASDAGWHFKDAVSGPPVYENGDFKLYSMQ